MRRRTPYLSIAFLGSIAWPLAGQFAASPVPTAGVAAEEFARRRAASGATLLMVTAHPDDEDNALAALLRWRHGVRVVLWTMTRGEAGQNEIGFEQGDDLKPLREEELNSAHRFDGIEQFWRGDTPDFGYSFSTAETLALWRPERPGLGLQRSVLQEIRPDVVLVMSPEGDGGGQHHQTSALLMLEECALLKNPWRADGLAADGSAWHVPSKVYGADRANWALGSRPASRPDSGPHAGLAVESVAVDVFEPLLGRTFRELAAEARSMHKSQGMSRLLDPVGPATRRYKLMIDRTGVGARSAESRPADEIPLFGGVALRPGSSPPVAPESRPATTSDAFACRGEVVKAKTPEGKEVLIPVPETGDVVPGVVVRSAGDVFGGEQRDPVYVVPEWDVRVEPPLLVVPRPEGEGVRRAPVRVRVRRNAEGVAWAAPVLLPLGLGVGSGVASESPGPVEFGEDDEVVFSMTAVIGAEGGDGKFVVFMNTGPTRDDAASAQLRDGFSGRREIDYPHVTRRIIHRPAEAVVRIVDMTPPPPVRVGYVRGIGETTDLWLPQLGAEVSSLDEEALAAGNLDRFDVLVIGARAYEFRPDLRRHHRRLMERVARGAVMICQYQKSGIPFAEYAPHPAKIGSGRVTDEDGPVELLDAEHPLFTTPNRIGSQDWRGWVRDRGLYFLEPEEAARPHYRELLKAFDTHGANAGPHAGALVETRVGDGRWIYCGLALWRQLPEGVPGAWRLWANLLALR